MLAINNLKNNIIKPVLVSAFSTFIFLAGCDNSAAIDQEIKAKAEAARAQKDAADKKAPTISVAEKKANFFSFLHPLIQQANAEVLEQRKTLLALSDDVENLSEKQSTTLAALVKSYKVDEQLTPAEQVEQLKVKIQTIPASLVLAQAANESAWGTSRFATDGNNYFGQWCFRKGCGLVPANRSAGANHEVAKFKTPLDSVKSYIRNLNSFPPYESLRSIRQQARDEEKPVSGIDLANGLIDYSERREEYVKEIQGMIRFNKLWRFNESPNATTGPKG